MQKKLDKAMNPSGKRKRGDAGRSGGQSNNIPEPRVLSELRTSLLSEHARSKLMVVLAKCCPETTHATKQARESWADELLAGLEEKHGCGGDSNNSETTLRAHARLIMSNMKRNASNLSRFSPRELVNLSEEELASGSLAARLREKAQLGGWDTPAVPSPLPALSLWNSAPPNKRLVLVLRDHLSHRAFEQYFSNIPRVDVVQCDDILEVEGTGTADAFISPANTMGNMDGGIDRAYANHFGWSYGRPYDSPNLLQLAIDRYKGELNARLPIGEAILVRDGAHALIAAPTMSLPSKIPVGSRVVYKAARAAFALWRKEPDIGVVRMPAFGAGWGRVPPLISASQTWEAFVSAWEP